jgi:hypothetical protein
MAANTSYHQYEPLRVPQSWGSEEKKFILQLTDILDDVYTRFNRLRFEDLGTKLQKRIEDGEGYASEVNQTARQIILAVSGGSTIYDTEPTTGMLEGDLWKDGDTYYRYESGAWVDTGLTNLITRLGQISSLILTAEEIISTVTGSTIYKTDLAEKLDSTDIEDMATKTYVSEVNSTEISQRNDAIEFSVTAERERAESVEGEIKLFTDIAQTYFLFSALGLSIGKSGSPFRTVLSDTKLSFMDGEIEVAYFSNNKMYIRNAEVINVLTVGDATDGYTDFNTVTGGLRGAWRAE